MSLSWTRLTFCQTHKVMEKPTQGPNIGSVKGDPNTLLQPLALPWSNPCDGVEGQGQDWEGSHSHGVVEGYSPHLLDLGGGGQKTL